MKSEGNNYWALKKAAEIMIDKGLAKMYWPKRTAPAWWVVQYANDKQGVELIWAMIHAEEGISRHE